MKILFSILTIFILNFHTLCQVSNDIKYFKGRISYKGEFVNKSKKYDSLTLSMVIAKYTDVYYKEGNVLTNSYNTISFQDVYRVIENKMYVQKISSDSVFWTDCSTPGFKIINYVITPKKEKILGIVCDELKVFFENKTITNYYNSDTLKVNPEWHKQYTFYNEDFYSEKMKSISLKFIIERADYIATYTAVSFKYFDVLDDSFKIPKNKALVKDE